MRKFHVFVKHALLMYEDRPFTKKDTISKQVANLMLIYEEVKTVINGKRKVHLDSFLDRWTHQIQYNQMTFTDSSSPTATGFIVNNEDGSTRTYHSVHGSYSDTNNNSPF